MVATLALINAKISNMSNLIESRRMQTSMAKDKVVVLQAWLWFASPNCILFIHMDNGIFSFYTIIQCFHIVFHRQSFKKISVLSLPWNFFKFFPIKEKNDFLQTIMEAMSKNQYMIMARMIEVYFFLLHLENPMMLIFTKVNKIFP